VVDRVTEREGRVLDEGLARAQELDVRAGSVRAGSVAKDATSGSTSSR